MLVPINIPHTKKSSLRRFSWIRKPVQSCFAPVESSLDSSPVGPYIIPIGSSNAPRCVAPECFLCPSLSFLQLSSDALKCRPSRQTLLPFQTVFESERSDNLVYERKLDDCACSGRLILLLYLLYCPSFHHQHYWSGISGPYLEVISYSF